MIIEAIIAVILGIGKFIVGLISIPAIPIQWLNDGILFLSNHFLGYVFYFVDGWLLMGVLISYLSFYLFVYGWGLIRMILGRS